MNPYAYIKDEKQIETLQSIKRVDEKGYLYHMDCTYDYYNIPDAFKVLLDAGCSTFVTKNLDGDILMCRNYDYSHYPLNDKTKERTGLNVIVENKNPNAKYKSLGVSDSYWIDFKNGTAIEGMLDDGKTDISAFILCPYLCMEGINDAGLAVSIMALPVQTDWEEIDYDTYHEKEKPNIETKKLEKEGEVPDRLKPYVENESVWINEFDHRAWIAHQKTIETKKENQKTYLHPIAMRLMLDNCANVNEAIGFMNNINVKSAMPGADYHILVADKEGNSRLLEWQGDEMKVVDINHATNYFVSRDDHFGLGQDRDDVILAAFERTKKGGMREDFAKLTLNMVAQDPTNGNDKGKTQYSCIYNLTKKTLRVFSFGDFSKSWDFTL